MAFQYPSIFLGTPQGDIPASIILPTGETGYLNPYKGTYTTKRDYALRMQRGFLRGESQSVSRGHKAVGGLTESQWRRLRRLYVNEINRRTWKTGPSRMNVIEGQRDDPRIFRQDVQYIVELFNGGYRDPNVPTIDNWLGYVEWRLAERLAATREYQDMGNATFGRADYYMRSPFWLQQGPGMFNMFDIKAGPTIELWYYH